jgi:hypothetical protein
VSYVPKVAIVSWLSILDCLIGFLYRLFTWHEYCSLQQKIQKDNNDVQNTTQKTKNRATKTTLKTYKQDQDFN